MTFLNFKASERFLLDLEDIGKKLKHENRFSLPEKQENQVMKFCEHHKKLRASLEVGSIFYRARVNDVGQKTAYDLDKMSAPPNEKASSGRINPEGISYLYGASDTITAVSEVRPWRGAVISVSKFRLKRKAVIVDLTHNDNPALNNESELETINNAIASCMTSKFIKSIYFSAPTHINDKHAYLASQYISEKIKLMEFDGIKYPSVLNNGGENICLFDNEIAHFIDCKTVSVNKVEYSIS